MADCRKIDLPDNSAAAIYASHVLEHVPYIGEAGKALAEWYRLLQPGGRLMVAVPDIEAIFRLFLDPAHGLKERARLLPVIYGAQVDEHDRHLGGYDLEMLGIYLHTAWFTNIRLVSSFGLFKDASEFRFNKTPISLNVEARKP